MLTSLFGDLRSARDAKAKSSEFEDTQVVGGSQDFAATAIMESTATEVNDVRWGSDSSGNAVLACMGSIGLLAGWSTRIC